MTYTLLCNLCESGTQTVVHYNFNLLGIAGFLLVVFMLANDLRRKKKAKEQAEATAKVEETNVMVEAVADETTKVEPTNVVEETPEDK